MPRQSEIGFTPEQIKLLAVIHILADRMEDIKNSGKVHAVIALIQELTRPYIDIYYFIEKAGKLFDVDLKELADMIESM
jgi:hypothetical protein